MITGNIHEIGLKWGMKKEKVTSQWELLIEEERKMIKAKKGCKHPSGKYSNDKNN